MFKNIWNEFRATQETLEEKKKNEDNTNDVSDDGDGMDKVQPKALKKKFKDRKDKDIDNDGDVDSSDEYLHNRRKTVSKKVDENDDEDMDNGKEVDTDDDKKKKKKVIGKEKEGDIEVNPKMEKEKMNEAKASIRDRLMSVLGEDAAKNRNPNSAKAEKPEDALKGKGAKDMMDQPVEVNDDEEKGHDDASKAGKVTKPAGARSGGDAVRSGDQKIKGVMAAYQKMKGK